MTNKEKNSEFTNKFFNSLIVQTACRNLPFAHIWNKMKFIDRLVYLRNKIIEKRIDLSVQK